MRSEALPNFAAMMLSISPARKGAEGGSVLSRSRGLLRGSRKGSKLIASSQRKILARVERARGDKIARPHANGISGKEGRSEGKRARAHASAAIRSWK